MTCTRPTNSGVCGAPARVIVERVMGFVVTRNVCPYGHSVHGAVEGIEEGPERPFTPRVRPRPSVPMAAAESPVLEAPRAPHAWTWKSGVKRTPEWIEELRRVWNAGWTAARIAKHMGLPRSNYVSGYAANYRKQGYDFTVRGIGNRAGSRVPRIGRMPVA